MERTIAREWLWILSMLILGAGVAPLILYGASTYHYEYERVHSSSHTDSFTYPRNVRVSNGLDTEAVRFNRHQAFTLLSEKYDTGTFEEFNKRMDDPAVQERLFTTLHNDSHFVYEGHLEARRIDESGYTVYFSNIRRYPHCLLLLTPYFICLFLRFTYWSTKTILSKRGGTNG